MKLIFKKNNEDIDIKIDLGDEEVNFDYLKFINLLFEGNDFDEPEFDEEILEEDKEKLKAMINEINEIVESQTNTQK